MLTVTFRSAWCGLRDAGKRAGLDLVLQPRPWGDPLDPLAGGRQAVASDVLRVRVYSFRGQVVEGGLKIEGFYCAPASFCLC